MVQIVKVIILPVLIIILPSDDKESTFLFKVQNEIKKSHLIPCIKYIT